MSTSFKPKQREKLRQQDRLAKKQARQQFLKHFKPLLFAILSWIIINAILHLPSLRESVQHFFIKFTLDSAVGLGKLLFLPVESKYFPGITVNGFNMQIIMECTAYNFYIFVVCLSLFSPIKWKQRLVTLIIFLAAIFIINNMRFLTMGYLGTYNAELFHNIHDYLWNILFGFLVFLIWLWRYKNNSLDKQTIRQPDVS